MGNRAPIATLVAVGVTTGLWVALGYCVYYAFLNSDQPQSMSKRDWHEFVYRENYGLPSSAQFISGVRQDVGRDGPTIREFVMDFPAQDMPLFAKKLRSSSVKPCSGKITQSVLSKMDKPMIESTSDWPIASIRRPIVEHSADGVYAEVLDFDDPKTVRAYCRYYLPAVP